MRSINLKITLAFVFVSLLGAALAAVFVYQRTQSAFGRFLFEQDKSAIVAALAEYYQANGSWTNVESVFRPGYISNGAPPQNPHFDNTHRPEDPGHSPFILIDANGAVVYGAPDPRRALTQAEIDAGTPIEVNGQVAGRLLESGIFSGWERNTPQGAFLVTVNRAIFFSALGTLLLALALGGLLARSLTRPLRDLSAATHRVAQGELGYQVEVRSRDEIGQLGTAFNQMSADLEKANRLRKQMTADIAHDLRTPLSILLGYTEALSDGKLDGSIEMYTTMHQMAQHLSHLVDDLRTISLADAGELPIQRQEVAPVSLLERVAAAYASRAQEKKVSLLVNAPADLPMLNVDLERMVQVLGNLINNALRYTREGGRVELLAAVDDSALRIVVSDNGAGIAAEDLPYIFNRFYRGDKSRQNNGDAGLGLTITKSLVEAQGGAITVESEPGQGAKFTITFPQKTNS